MNANLIRKLMISIVSLTTYFLVFIAAFHRDMTRPLSRSIAQLLPGLLMIFVGVAGSYVIGDPEFFKSLLIIKSGFARKILGSTLVPLICNAMYGMSIIGGQFTIIDKLLFYLRHRRMPYTITLGAVVGLTSIGAITLIVTILGSQPLIISTSEHMYTICTAVGVALAAINGVLIGANALKYIRSKTS